MNTLTLKQSRPIAFNLIICLAFHVNFQSAIAQQSPLGQEKNTTEQQTATTAQVSREPKFRLPEDWPNQRRELRKRLEAVMGPLPNRDQLPPLNLRVLEVLKTEHYVRQTIRLTAELGDDLSAYLYLPHSTVPSPLQSDLITPKRELKRPGVVALHPTHRIGKGVVDGQSERPNRGYARELAGRGYIVIAPDYPSFGELKNYQFKTDRYTSGTMKGIWNHARCVDLLYAREDVDARAIAAIGHSLGGHNAMFLGAFDDRVAVVISSCGWTPFPDYYDGNLKGWTSERYMPRIRDVYHLDPQKVPFDFDDVIALLAPRFFFSNSPLHDSNFDYRGVEKTIPVARRIYEQLATDTNHDGRVSSAEQREMAGRLRVVYPNTNHDFPPAVREEAYEFLEEALRKITRPKP